MKLEVRVTETESEEPVEGIEEALSLKIIGSNESRTLELGEAHGQPGRYRSALIFTEAGDYQAQVVGVIGTENVDVTFDFSVDDHRELLFPAKTTAAAGETLADTGFNWLYTLAPGLIIILLGIGLLQRTRHAASR